MRRNDTGTKRLGYSSEKHPNVLHCVAIHKNFNMQGKSVNAETCHPEIGLMGTDSWDIILSGAEVLSTATGLFLS